jgi:hypothetical protein
MLIPISYHVRRISDFAYSLDYAQVLYVLSSNRDNGFGCDAGGGAEVAFVAIL